MPKMSAWKCDHGEMQNLLGFILTVVQETNSCQTNHLPVMSGLWAGMSAWNLLQDILQETVKHGQIPEGLQRLNCEQKQLTVADPEFAYLRHDLGFIHLRLKGISAEGMRTPWLKSTTSKRSL